MSDSCSKATDFRSIFDQIENGRFCRPLTSAVMPWAESFSVSTCAMVSTTRSDLAVRRASRWVMVA